MRQPISTSAPTNQADRPLSDNKAAGIVAGTIMIATPISAGESPAL